LGRGSESSGKKKRLETNVGFGTERRALTGKPITISKGSVRRVTKEKKRSTLRANQAPGGSKKKPPGRDGNMTGKKKGGRKRSEKKKKRVRTRRHEGEGP